MNIIFLLAPSEWKNSWWEWSVERRTFEFEKPISIAVQATQKDLKCKGERFDEWIFLNKHIDQGPFLSAIERYSWVVFNAIGYDSMSQKAKNFFEKHVYILSGMYGMVQALDTIWNYKLPIETKWLYAFWWNKITDTLRKLNPDIIINLLPWSYAKMIHFSKLDAQIVEVNFYKPDWKKMSHGVKKYRGEFLRNICEKQFTSYEQFWWKVVKNDNNNIEVNFTIE